MNDFAPVDIHSTRIRGIGTRRVEPGREDATRNGITKPTITRGADRIDLSPEARAASQSKVVGGETRTDLVARVRTDIAAGQYLTPDKINRAIDEVERDLSTEFIKNTTS